MSTTPQPNNEPASEGEEWFSTEVDYSGRGELEVADPHGVVTGTVEITSSEGERAQVRMEVSGSRSDELGEHFQVRALVFGERPREGQSAISLGLSGSTNTCVALELETTAGRLHAEDISIIRTQVGSSGLILDLSLHGKASFKPHDSGTAAYLALPLLNFTGELPIAFEALTEHPLRLLGERPADTRRKTPIQPVEVNECSSFIQPLQDKDNRLERLRKRDTSVLITHLWVIELPDGGVDEPYEWAPLHLLDLLSLGSGTEVKVPWMETRDEAGGLCRRIHRPFVPPRYRSGHSLFDRVSSGGWRDLLERAQSTPGWPDGDLQMAAICLRRATSEGEYNVEDRWLSVCRALDALASYHGVESRDLLDDLSPHQRAELEAAREMAISRINELRSSTTDQHERRALQQLQGKFGNVSRKKAGEFGYRIREAVSRAGFPDPDIVDRYLSNSNWLGSSDWDDLLSSHRGEVAHGGSFDCRNQRSKLRALVRVARHLTDLGLRLLLSSVGYREPMGTVRSADPEVAFTTFPVAPRSWSPPTISDAEYYPTTLSADGPRLREPRSVNWVKSSTDPKELGYP